MFAKNKVYPSWIAFCFIYGHIFNSFILKKGKIKDGIETYKLFLNTVSYSKNLCIFSISANLFVSTFLQMYIKTLSIPDSPVYYPSRDEVYKNVYCFICNNKAGEKARPSCYRFTKDRFTSEFVEIMDLQTDFSHLAKTGNGDEKCEDNEVFDELFVCSLINILFI